LHETYPHPEIFSGYVSVTANKFNPDCEKGLTCRTFDGMDTAAAGSGERPHGKRVEDSVVP
jgi:hypothetical protein